MNDIMPEAGRHNWADLLKFIDRIRWIAYHHMDDPADQMRRIRDEFLSHDHPEVDE
ncbi:MAG TPA: hypothetical protein VHI11_10145 [Jiangellaceae bacterium]|nr:hypothetical protein [Jiangellaceae bacterium]